MLAVALALAAVLAVLGTLGLRGIRSRFSPPRLLGDHMATVAQPAVGSAAIRTRGGVVLIDAGQDPEGHAIDALLGALHAGRDDVHDIFLTHGHGDHTAAVPLFPRARVWAGASDVALAAGEVPPEALAARAIAAVLPPVVARVGHVLTDDEQVDLGGTMLRAIPVPGHTPGSYAYLVDGVLFVGDAMAADDGELVPVPSAFDARPHASRAGAVHLAATLAPVPIDQVCAAHGGCTPPHTGSAALARYAGSLSFAP